MTMNGAVVVILVVFSFWTVLLLRRLIVGDVLTAAIIGCAALLHFGLYVLLWRYVRRFLIEG